MSELVDVAFTIYSHNDRISPHIERLQFTNLPMDRVKDAIDLLNDDPPYHSPEQIIRAYENKVARTRTEDFKMDELFPQGTRAVAYTLTCTECACEVKNSLRFIDQHTTWHNKLLP